MTLSLSKSDRSRRGYPPNQAPCASETPLFDRSSINSFGNFVWAQGPRRDFPSLRSMALCPISPDRGDLFTTTGSRGVGLGPWSLARYGRIEALSPHAPRVRISFAPPLALAETDDGPSQGPFLSWKSCATGIAQEPVLELQHQLTFVAAGE